MISANNSHIHYRQVSSGFVLETVISKSNNGAHMKGQLSSPGLAMDSNP